MLYVLFSFGRNENSEHNQKLLAGLSEGPHSAMLLKLTRDDAALGRMSEPRPVTEADVSELRLHPRFGVEQGTRPDGTRPDGSMKLRAVDNFSWSALQGRKKRKLSASVNGHCRIPEELHHDHIDVLMETATILQEDLSETPGLWKADIDSAFRRIPVALCMMWAAAVTFIADGETWVSKHFAMPFGAKASVFAWERVGHFIATNARKLLKLPVLRYVDDFFGAEPRESLEHAADCFARIVRAMLGAGALADDKRDHGISMTVLGIRVEMSAEGFRLMVAAKKVRSRPFPPGDARSCACRCVVSGREVHRADHRCVKQRQVDAE